MKDRFLRVTCVLDQLTLTSISLRGWTGHPLPGAARSLKLLAACSYRLSWLYCLSWSSEGQPAAAESLKVTWLFGLHFPPLPPLVSLSVGESDTVAPNVSRSEAAGGRLCSPRTPGSLRTGKAWPDLGYRPPPFIPFSCSCSSFLASSPSLPQDTGRLVITQPA